MEAHEIKFVIEKSQYYHKRFEDRVPALFALSFNNFETRENLKGHEQDLCGSMTLHVRQPLLCGAIKSQAI
jgi:hypothetical protein